MTIQTAKAKLKELKQNLHTTKLEKAVINETLYQLDGYNKPQDYFNDLLSHGCVSGMIGSLIYYYDTHKFALEHMEEILELESDLEEQGIEVKPENDKLNWYAWFGFEETSRQLAEKLGLEI